jgi:hypothetical protein
MKQVISKWKDKFVDSLLSCFNEPTTTRKRRSPSLSELKQPLRQDSVPSSYQTTSNNQCSTIHRNPDDIVITLDIGSSGGHKSDKPRTAVPPPKINAITTIAILDYGTVYSNACVWKGYRDVSRPIEPVYSIIQKGKRVGARELFTVDSRLISKQVSMYLKKTCTSIDQ